MTRVEAVWRTFWRAIRRNRRYAVLSALALLVALGLLLTAAYRWDATGFGVTPIEVRTTLPAYQRVTVYLPAKTVWDWLQLLFVPLSIGLIGFLLDRAAARRDQRNDLRLKRIEQQRRRQQWHADRQWQEQQKAADDARALMAQQDAALDQYFDRMSDLLLHERLRDHDEQDNIWHVARARTLAILARLTAESGRTRKGVVLRFLYDARLLGKAREGSAASWLTSADLRDAQLAAVYLPGVNLGGVNLDGATLHGATLDGVGLLTASLVGADLSAAALTTAMLHYANLTEANLSAARMDEARLDGANLSQSNLFGAKLQRARCVRTDFRSARLRYALLTEARLEEANLSQADLTGAILQGAVLTRAQMQYATLVEANLTEADLSGADLTGVDLSRALLERAILRDTIVQPEQLRQARSVTGAILPDGHRG